VSRVATLACLSVAALTFAQERGARESESASAQPTGGTELLGRPLPVWGEGARFLDGDAPRVRGRVVLLRFWTETCPYCARSAPALAELDRRYRRHGLVIVGVYHPKPRWRAPREVSAVRDAVRRFGWRFPVLLDQRWRYIDRVWTRSGAPRRFTSASVLADREGVIRHVHRGPELRASGTGRAAADYAALVRAIEAALQGEVTR